jgi:hypothetical protein
MRKLLEALKRKPSILIAAILQDFSAFVLIVTAFTLWQLKPIEGFALKFLTLDTRIVQPTLTAILVVSAVTTAAMTIFLLSLIWQTVVELHSGMSAERMADALDELAIAIKDLVKLICRLLRAWLTKAHV